MVLSEKRYPAAGSILHEPVLFLIVTILSLSWSSSLDSKNPVVILVDDDLLALLFHFIIFNEEVFIKLTNDLQGHEVFHNIKYCCIKDDDKVTDYGNEVANENLSKACQECIAPSGELPLVIDRVFHLVHSVADLFCHLCMHGEASDKTS